VKLCPSQTHGSTERLIDRSRVWWGSSYHFHLTAISRLPLYIASLVFLSLKTLCRGSLKRVVFHALVSLQSFDASNRLIVKSVNDFGWDVWESRYSEPPLMHYNVWENSIFCCCERGMRCVECCPVLSIKPIGMGGIEKNVIPWTISRQPKRLEDDYVVKCSCWNEVGVIVIVWPVDICNSLGCDICNSFLILGCYSPWWGYL